jgi:AraC family transcriptional regulator
MVVYVKNMVCERCIMAVRQELQQLGLAYHHVQLGEIELLQEPSQQQLTALSNALLQIGFELLDDRKARTVEKIKTTIVSLIHRNDDDGFHLKLSALLEEKLGLDYAYLSTLFSSVEGITIEKYAILQRIEKVKELLVYDELSLGEIADQLGYSSVQHLSLQFKKITGLTASEFRNLKEKRRIPLDKI